MKKVGLAGIDVSARELVVALERNGRARPIAVFSNDPAGHRKLLRLLTKGGWGARVCLEATGVYSLDVSLALHRAKGVEVMVVNPRVLSDFAKAYLGRSKTDPLDAEAALAFALRMPFVAWRPPAQEVLDLRALSRRVAGLSKMLVQEKNRLHAATQSRESSEVLREDLEQSIAELKERIARLRGRALEIIRSHEHLSRPFDHMVSVKGIAEASAIALLGELAVLPADMTPRQWVAHAGLDPRHHESGSSVHKKPRISKKGNVYLRASLYMPALVASQHEPHVQAFYEKLIDEGKTSLQALTAVMRKLLHSIHGMWSHDRDFIGKKFYAMNA